MKKIALIFLLIVFSKSLIAQPELTGAMGLTFGMNAISVKNIMMQKGGIVETSKTGKLIITNITMGTEKPTMVFCDFSNNKLYDISIYFSPTFEAKTQELFDEISKIIVSKYGEGKSFRNFKGIYKDGDGYEMQAIKLGYADIVTYWNKFLNDNVIALEIFPLNNNLYIKLSYQDDKLAAELEKQQSIKDNAEF
jgi:hypothetical protein